MLTYPGQEGSLCSTEELTFLLVEGGQDAVVPAHLEVNLLLHALWNCALWNDDADARLNGTQDPSVTVEDPTSGGHHRVSFIFVVIIQRTGAEGRERSGERHQSNQLRQRIKHSRGHKSKLGTTKFLSHSLSRSVITLIKLAWGGKSVSPYRDGLGNGVDVIVLVFGPVVHSACEGVQATVMIKGLR